ncbi:MAG: DUF2079 domain-containing protein [Phycisphaerales bacterium]|nr:DUF2079 domain-containing protein [Phycisphaerales bacterium]
MNDGPAGWEIAPIQRAKRWGRLPTAFGVGAVVVNLCAMFHLLAVSRVDAVKYECLLPPDAAMWGSSLGQHVAPAVLVALILGGWAHALKHRANGVRLFLSECRSWILPGALACPWLCLVVADARARFLLLCAGILLLGFSIGRFAASVIRNASIPEQAKGLEPRLGRADSQPCTPPGGPHARAISWIREPAAWVLLAMSVGLTAFHTYAQIRMHRGLAYGSPDIGYYAEMLLNVLRGRGLMCEGFGHHFFAEHFSPGLYLLVPLYAIYPHIETLMLLGAAFMMSGSVPVYAMARVRGCRPHVSLLLGVAYLAYPSTSRVIYGASYGFHEILMAVPLMLWSFRFEFARRRWAMAFCMATAIAVKEDVAVFYAAYGFYSFLRHRRNLAALALGMGCAFYLLLVMYWIVPSFNATGHYSKLYLYEQLGAGPAQIALSFLTRPSVVFAQLVSWRPFGFALVLLIPVGLLAARRAALLTALPTFTFICLMNPQDFASLRFWHQSSILPVVWLATLDALSACSSHARRVGAAATVLACAALAHYALGFSPLSRVWADMPKNTERQERMIEELHRRIPIDDDVQASARLAAHFVRQNYIYPLQADPAHPPEWILVDEEEDFIEAESRAWLDDRVRHWLESDEFDVHRVDSVLVLRRRRR